MKKNISLVFTAIIIASCSREAPIPSLKEQYEKHFPIGAAVGQKQLQGPDGNFLNRNQFID